MLVGLIISHGVVEEREKLLQKSFLSPLNFSLFLLNDRWAAGVEVGLELVGVGDAQDGFLVENFSEELEADGQTGRIESAGDA